MLLRPGTYQAIGADNPALDTDPSIHLHYSSLNLTRLYRPLGGDADDLDTQPTSPIGPASAR